MGALALPTPSFLFLFFFLGGGVGEGVGEVARPGSLHRLEGISQSGFTGKGHMRANVASCLGR